MHEEERSHHQYCETKFQNIEVFYNPEDWTHTCISFLGSSSHILMNAKGEK